MYRFAAQQPGVDGKPLYYLLEYETFEVEDTKVYVGKGYVTKEFNKDLSAADEAFNYSFERKANDWSVINNIKVGSQLGEEMAERIRNTFFKDLVLSGTMAFEQRQSAS